MNFLRNTFCIHLLCRSTAKESKADATTEDEKSSKEQVKVVEEEGAKKGETKEGGENGSDCSEGSSSGESDDDDGSSETTTSSASTNSTPIGPRKGGLIATCCCCLRPFFPSLRVDRTKSSEKLETIKLLMLGLDNAGKTTVALHLAGESVDDVVSTIGFSNYELKAENFCSNSSAAVANSKKEAQEAPESSIKYRIVLYDLGGGTRIRSIWKNYYSLVHGIVFVIDSADIERILEVKELMQEVVSNPKVAGKPILIYLNKQDLHDAMDEIDVCKFTHLEELVSQYKCITKIEAISAQNVPIASRASGQRGHPAIDPALESSFRWLLDFIEENWLELDGRVQTDSEEQIANENNSLQERIDRTKQKQQYIEIETNVPINHAEVPVTTQAVDTVTENTKAYLQAVTSKTPARLSPIEEDSIVAGDEEGEESNEAAVKEEMKALDESGERIDVKETIVIAPNEKTLIKSIMKKPEGGGNSETPLLNLADLSAKPPLMEIIVTQPGSGGSGTSTDSRHALGLSRSNKIYPS